MTRSSRQTYKRHKLPASVPGDPQRDSVARTKCPGHRHGGSALASYWFPHSRGVELSWGQGLTSAGIPTDRSRILLGTRSRSERPPSQLCCWPHQLRSIELLIMVCKRSQRKAYTAQLVKRTVHSSVPSFIHSTDICQVPLCSRHSTWLSTKERSSRFMDIILFFRGVEGLICRDNIAYR